MTDLTGERWSNWAGNQSARPRKVVHPRGTDEIAAAVKDAAARGLTVKPIGAGHSCTGVGVTAGVQLRMDRHARLLEIDVGAGLVTVESGMTIQALSRELASVGLALSNLGALDLQTISGAINTGTHGTGLAFGGLATQVRALDLVLADGSVVHCTDTENADLFGAARVGLGAFGVVAAYTLQAVPAFALHTVEEPARFDQLVDDGRFAHLCDSVDHTEFLWFPHTSGCLLKTRTRVGLDAVTPRPPWRTWHDHDVLARGVGGAVTALGKLAPALIPSMNRCTSRALSAREFTLPSSEVSASAPRVRYLEMEYGVPRAELPGALRAIRSYVNSAGLEVSLPVEVRVAAPDEIWLSTAYQRESAYVAVRMVRGSAYDRYFSGVEKILSNVGGRPHWGTLSTMDAATLAERYPRFGDAQAVRDRVDPERVFGNDYTVRTMGA